MPTTTKLSFPTCMFRPVVYTFTRTNNPLWVSAKGQIRKSQSLKLVLDTLWKKPLPTTSTSLT